MLLFLVLVLAPAASVRATSLADLVASGASLNSGNGQLTFSNFRATARGPRANRDLSLYDVTAIDDGIVVMSSAQGRARVRLLYDVATSGTGIGGAELSIATSEDGGARGRGKLRDGRRAVGRLRVTQRAGREHDGVTFAALSALNVREKLRFVQGGAGEAFSHAFSVTAPEPGTALLLASGLGALGVLGRRRRR